MSPTDTPDQLVERFRIALKRPRACSAYGIDDRELNHNAFFHTLLGGDLGVDLLAAIARRFRERGEPWASLAAGNFKIDNRRFNLAGPKGRPDEHLELILNSGERIALIVEMKAQAHGGVRQLDEYVEALRNLKGGGRQIDGLLLRIPGTDVLQTSKYPVLDGAGYAASLQEALGHSSELDLKMVWLVEDYVKTLEFLRLRDEMIVRCGSILQPKIESDREDSLTDWVDENRRWIHERLLREVSHRVADALPGGVSPESPAADAKGGMLDFDDHTKRLSAVRDGQGARLFFKWRLGAGLEAHVITVPYGRPVPDVALEAKSRLWQATRECLRSVWAEHSCSWTKSPGKQRSRMVVRLVDDTWNVDDVVATLRERIDEVWDDLGRAVVGVRSRMS